MAPDPCPSKELLFGYLVGGIPERQAQGVAGHLASCRICEQTVQDLEGRPDTLIGALRQPASEDPHAAEPEARRVLERLRRRPTAAEKPATEKGPVARAEPPAEPRRITTLGDYELVKKLGQGGMGAVYEARHVKLKRTVALKVLSKNRLANAEAVARFEREMEAVGRLDHPNIVRAMDAREVGGVHLLVMEYVDGLDFAEIVRRVGPLSIADACEVARQAAQGLQCSHENGLVHRDIKPSNLMLSSSGVVKVLDLGLAQVQQAESTGGEITGVDQVMGTPDYMSPEQAMESRAVDIRTDLYSLGCTLYHLLAGRPPFSGAKYDTGMKKVAAHIHEEPPPIQLVRGDVPKPVAALVERLLVKDPQARVGTPGLVVDGLAPFCEGSKLIALLREARRKAPPAEEEPRAETEGPQAAVEVETSRDRGSVEPRGAAGDAYARDVGAVGRAAPNAAAAGFDPYHRWLGIPKEEQPADHYRLLSIPRFESDPEVIRDAAVRQMAHVRTYHLGQHAELSQRILNELAAAKAYLSNPEKKAAYDARLREKFATATPAPEKPAEPQAGPLDWLSMEIPPDSTPNVAPLRPRFRIGKPPAKGLVAAGAAGFVLALFGIVIYVATGKGTVKIALSDPRAQVEVKIDGDTIELAGLDQPLRLRPGEHELTIIGPGYEAVGRSFTVRRGANPLLEITLVPIASQASPVAASLPQSVETPSATVAAVNVPSPPPPVSLPQPRKPTLDGEGFFVVDGRRVFPIGMWAGGPPRDVCLNAGFNLVTVGWWEPDVALKLAPKKTILLLAHAGKLGETPRSIDGLARLAESQHVLACWAGMHKANQAAKDGLNLARVPEAVAAMERAGLRFPIMAGSHDREGFADLGSWLDVLYAWPGIFLEGGEPPSASAKLVPPPVQRSPGSSLVSEVALQEDARPGQTASPAPERLAALARCRAYLGVAFGANGLLFTGMQDTSTESPLWPHLVRLLKELQSVEKFLLASPDGPPASSGVCFGARRCGDEVLLIACNPTDAAVQGDILLPPATSPDEQLEVIGENRTVKASGGAIRDQFDPLGVHLYLRRVRQISTADSSRKSGPSPLPQQPLRVAIVTGDDNPFHDWRETSRAVRDLLQENKRLAVQWFENPEFLASDKLFEHQVVVLKFMNQKPLAQEQKARDNLLKFVREGGGLVVLHAASGAFPDWREFGQIAGRVLGRPPRHDPIGVVTVTIRDFAHPITQGMGDFEVRDELYTNLEGNQPVRVLANARSRVTGQLHPVAFVGNCGRGRFFHLALGHDAAAIRTQGVAELIRRGTAWVADKSAETRSAALADFGKVAEDEQRAPADSSLTAPTANPSVAVTVPPESDKPAPKPTAEGFIELFNGRDLEGWRVFGDAPFRVDNGMIVGSTKPGMKKSWLCAAEPQVHFLLEIEFKMDAGMNSGLQVRSRIRSSPQGDRVIYGCQVEMDTTGLAATGGIFDEGRTNRMLDDLRANQPARQAFRPGDWNTLRVLVQAQNIETWLNGVPAGKATEQELPKGLIAIQIHPKNSEGTAKEIRIRSVRLKPLSSRGG